MKWDRYLKVLGFKLNLIKIKRKLKSLKSHLNFGNCYGGNVCCTKCIFDKLYPN